MRWQRLYSPMVEPHSLWLTLEQIAPIPRLNFTGLCLQDGPLAIRQADYASVFPAGLTVAAAWDRGLAKKRGDQLGAEYKGKGSHIALGPVAGPLGRSGYGGRNWGVCWV